MLCSGHGINSTRSRFFRCSHRSSHALSARAADALITSGSAFLVTTANGRRIVTVVPPPGT